MRGSRHTIIGAVLSIILLLPAASARSDRGALVEIGRPARIPTALDSVRHSWPGIALALSATATAIPIAITTRPHPRSVNDQYMAGLVAGEVVAPAAGYLYAGLGRQALRGIVVRSLAAGVVIANYNSLGDHETPTWGDIGVLLGLTVVGISAVIDVASVPNDVVNRNKEWLITHARVGVRALDDGKTTALALSIRY